MLAHPLVSVVIPVYKVEPYLRQCLDSVRSQTLRDIEIICVNDCSPDNSLAILREYEKLDERVQVIDFPKNRGISAARNAGLTVAKGAYVAFLDSDDWVEPEMYEKLYEAVTSHPDISVSYCDYSNVNKNLPTNQGKVRRTNPEFPAGNHLPEAFRHKNFIQIWCCLIKRDLLTSNDILFPEGCWFEDLLSVVCMVMSKRIVRVPHALHNYRITEGSFCNSTNYHPTFTGIQSASYFADMYIRLGVREVWPEEVDFSEIRLLLGLSIVAFRKFNPPAVQYIPLIRKQLKERHPDYRGNKYYQELPFKEKFNYSLLMQGKSGVLLFRILRWGRKLLLGKRINRRLPASA